MNIANLLASLVMLSERVRHSKTMLYYVAAIAVGLGCARFADAMVFYSVSNIKAPVAKKGAKRPIVSNRAPDATPTTIVGGPLFNEAENVVESSAEAAPQQTTNFTLNGTLEGHRSFARAVIQVAGEKSTREYAVGNKIGEARLTYIGREYIWVRQAGQKMKVEVGENTQKKLQAAQTAKAKSAIKGVDKPTAGGTVVKVLSREEVNKKILGNPAQIYKGASFGPKLENGKISGYKINRVTPGHIFYTLGARSGDIIRKVNGFPLSDTERMFELWKSMKTASRIKVDLERGGKVIKYDFHIRN